MPTKSKQDRSARLHKIGQELQEALDRKQTPFLRQWLKRNLGRWRRLVHEAPPFKPEASESRR